MLIKNDHELLHTTQKKVSRWTGKKIAKKLKAEINKHKPICIGI